ncbi:MAG: methylated-DNA--[protein]-cysteine S-methyltransferase [Alistipes sp.]|nr:methylated-DNA--[protein]-cysteine S-methyltransferase [Alistipes sp.]
MERTRIIATPVGPMGIAATQHAVTRIFFADGEPPTGPAPEHEDDAPAVQLLRRAERELGEYFAGRRRDFTLPLAPAGTPFQQAVWAELRRIPYGCTRSYGQIARAIGRPAACRAVGMANHRNPIAIVIPCHRVVGAGGALTGYAGGLEAKSRLLEIEKGAAE